MATWAEAAVSMFIVLLTISLIDLPYLKNAFDEAQCSDTCGKAR